MEESIKVGCCFFCMCCVCFGFDTFDCCFLAVSNGISVIQSITSPLPPNLPRLMEESIMVGCCFFCMCCFYFGFVSFDCCIWLLLMQFQLIQSIPRPPPLPCTEADGGTIKVGCCFSCMCCLWFCFVSFDCCVFCCFSCIFTLFSPSTLWMEELIKLCLFDCCLFGCFSCNFTFFTAFFHWLALKIPILDYS